MVPMNEILCVSFRGFSRKKANASILEYKGKVLSDVYEAASMIRTQLNIILLRK